jgi:hypothetical protein
VHPRKGEPARAGETLPKRNCFAFQKRAMLRKEAKLWGILRVRLRLLEYPLSWGEGIDKF